MKVWEGKPAAVWLPSTCQQRNLRQRPLRSPAQTRSRHRGAALRCDLGLPKAACGAVRDGLDRNCRFQPLQPALLCMQFAKVLAHTAGDMPPGALLSVWLALA